MDTTASIIIFVILASIAAFVLYRVVRNASRNERSNTGTNYTKPRRPDVNDY